VVKPALGNEETPGRLGGVDAHGAGGIARLRTFNHFMKEADNHFVKEADHNAATGQKRIKKFIFILQCSPNGKNYAKKTSNRG
jgi:hypothetical protein